MQGNSDKSESHGFLLLLLVLAVIAASSFKAVAHPPKSIWGNVDGELRVYASLFLPINTSLFFMCLIKIGFLIIGFPFEKLLRVIVVLWSLMFLCCLLADMPSRLLDYGALGVSVAVIFFYYRMVKEEYRRQHSALNEAEAVGKELV